MWQALARGSGRCVGTLASEWCLKMSGPTLRGLFTKVKDPLPIKKQAGIVYEVPWTCGKVYIGETKRRLGTHLKEHKDACSKCLTDKSAIVKHAWPPNQLEGNEDPAAREQDHAACLERGTQHTWDTWRRTLQPRQRIRATWLLDRHVQ